MILAELVRACRERLDDLGGDMEGLDWETDDSPLLWSNDELTRYANQAEREFCRRRPIEDAETAAVCTIAVTAGIPVYPYSDRIVGIKRAKLDSMDRPLTKVTRRWLDTERWGWEGLTDETDFYLDDLTEGRLRVVGAPTADDTLRLTVGRYPLADMAWADRDTVSPEIPLKHHDDLIHWMLHLAYLKADAETFDAKRAGGFADLFEAEVGPRIDAVAEQGRRRRSDLIKRTRVHY